MSGGWEFIAGAWLVTFLGFGGYAFWLHRSLGRSSEGGESGE